MSDKYGRKKTLITILSLGTMTFFISGFITEFLSLLLMIIIFTGMVLGSMFTMGISYMTDSTPKSLLPTGNII
ncbi:MFS transporter [Pseudalkalibacillus sp. R45]|uniref:MFS transporter n=1 Tax=Pseudalkalibacillus sp. R45 TaxID=3457433 RepID=UPI003FCD52A1